MYGVCDFNTYVNVVSNCSLRRGLEDFQTIFDINQVINEPTRITTTSSTTIDLILVSDPLKISQSGVTSDQLLTYCTRKVKKELYNKRNNGKIRPKEI